MLEAFCFDVQIYRVDNGKFGYSISQEFEESGSDEPQWELLEQGEVDTVEEAAEAAKQAIKTLFA